MSNELGLLQRFVAASGTSNEIEDSESFGCSFNFEDFEKDLDFINEHLEEEPSKEDDNQAALNKDEAWGKDSIIEANEDIASDGTRSFPNTIDNYRLASKSDEQPNISCNEDELSNSDRPIKKVSFNLSENTEYSDDFESSIEEDIEDEEEKEGDKSLPSSFEDTHKNSDKPSEIFCEEDPIQNSDCKVCTSEVFSDLDQTSGIKACSTCNCRLTRMHILDTTELSDLFSKRKIKSKRKLAKGKAQKSKKNRKNGLNTCDKTVEDVDKRNVNDVKQFKKSPTSTFWNKSSNSSLLQWLKLKNKEERIKRTTERKERKEEKQAKRQEEFDKLWRKEVSDRKVEEWMKRKKQEDRALRKHKVAPYSEVRLLQNPSSVPHGYTVLDSFEKKERTIENPKPKEKGARKMSSKQKLTNEYCNAKNKINKGSEPENEKTTSQYESRKSYDEWLQEKKISTLLTSKKHQAMRTSNDDKLFAKERARRQKIKDNSMKKVSSNWDSQSSSLSTKIVSFKEHDPEPIKGQKQQYKWAEKRSNSEQY